ncbi:ankyrin repeat-containing domain protein [Bipolaris maydis]|nr:ankyrin repeat-containing domain protein [Bipolaris maydis]
MEALSAAASILAVIGAAEKVAKGLQPLQDFIDAEQDVQACCNEISALRASSSEILELLNASLMSVRASLLKLDTVLHYQILSPSESGARPLPHQQVLKRNWLKGKKKVERSRREIRQARSNILDVVELADIIEFRLTGLMMRFDSMLYTHAESQDQIFSALSNNHIAIDDLGRKLGTQIQAVGDTLSESMERSLQQHQRPMINSQGPSGNLPGTEEPAVIVMSSRPVRPHARDSIDIYRLWAPRIVTTEAHIFTMAQTGSVEGIRSLFTENRASPFDVDLLGFSALWFVLDTPTPLVDDNVAQTLKSMFDDLDRLNELYFTNLHQRILGLSVCEIEHVDEMAEHNINAIDAMGRTPLHWAVVRNDIANVRRLLDRGADPNKAAERSGWTSMHFAARARNLDPAILRLLLIHNADVDALDCHQQTPLSRAVRHGAEATRLLIDAGADLNLQYDCDKWCALHLAAWIGQTESMEVLLEAGANPLLQTIWGGNIIRMAQTHGPGEVLQVLDKFRTILRLAFERHGRGLSQSDLQEFRRENCMPQITDEWWTLWVDLVDDLYALGSIGNEET